MNIYDPDLLAWAVRLGKDNSLIQFHAFGQWLHEQNNPAYGAVLFLTRYRKLGAVGKAYGLVGYAPSTDSSISKEFTVEAEWYDRATKFTAYKYRELHQAAGVPASELDMYSTGFSKIALVIAWSQATPEERKRWEWVTSGGQTEKPDVQASVDALTVFAVQNGFTYSELLEDITKLQVDNWPDDRHDAAQDAYENFPAFWTHYAIVNGHPARNQDSPFSCCS